MKAGQVFQFTAPNGVKVAAIVIDIIKKDRDWKWYLCYAQNRIFHYQIIADIPNPVISVAVDYAILPEQDSILLTNKQDEG